MRLHSQLHNLHNMKLLVRETTGEMAEFEVNNDFQYPENKFWATQGGYVMTKVDGKMVYVHRIVLGLSAGNRKQGHSHRREREEQYNHQLEDSDQYREQSLQRAIEGKQNWPERSLQEKEWQIQSSTDGTN